MSREDCVGSTSLVLKLGGSAPSSGPFWLAVCVLGMGQNSMSTDGLDAHLMMQVGDEFFIGFGSHLLHPGLKSLLASVISLHTKVMYPFIILRKVQ